ncbi:MAG: TonB-dependent receptor, partial [Bacteroidota bacterium]
MHKKYYLLVLALMISLAGFAQNTVKGYVIDEAKDPLVGATVLIAGTNSGTLSDASGSFTIYLPDDADEITISYLGYETQTIKVGDQASLAVVMKLDISELEGVTVTGFSGTVGQARRRAASIQSIPESVVTLTSDQIDATGVNNVQSFAALVPNVSFQQSQNVGVNFINVRGIAQIRNGESPIAFTIDGINIPDPNLLNQELYDLAMVEVVKGPQGTLYGKNAIGGAINILTNPPTNYTKNKLTLGYGNGNNFRAGLSSSGPLVKDKLYYRVSGSYRNFDGVIDNETLGEPVDFYEEISVRGQLTLDVSSQFSATLLGQFSDTDAGATYYAHAPAGLQLDANDFDYVINADQRGTSFLRNSFIALKMDLNLGGASLRSVTSINNADRNHMGDLDFLPVDILRQDQDSETRTFNQEIRLGSTNTDAKFVWDLGAFYQSSDKTLLTLATADFGFFAEPAAPTGTQALLATLSDFVSTYNTFALFGFADYKVSDAFTLSFGLRWDNDDISQDNQLLRTNPTKTQSELQPKVSLSYQATDNILIYGNYGRGYRSGGFNSDATALYDSDYEGETSNSYELGFKSSTEDDRFIFNAAAFLIDFTNQQQYAVAIGAGNGALVLGNYNLPRTEVTGVEAEIKWRASKYFDILAGFGYTSSVIKEGGNAGGTDRTGFEGNTTPFVPRTTANIAIQSAFPISDKVDFGGFVNLSQKGEIYWHEDNIDKADPFTLLDTRLTLTIDKKFTIGLWGNNLLDTDYYQEYFAGEISGSAAGDIGWIGQPTTVGIDLSV